MNDEPKGEFSENTKRVPNSLKLQLNYYTQIIISSLGYLCIIVNIIL